MMKIELFHTRGCAACVATKAELRTAAQQAVQNLEWCEVNVALGVLTLPSIAIDGKLVFTSMPTVAQLREALIARNRGAA
jgi:thioredoxin 1